MDRRHFIAAGAAALTVPAQTASAFAVDPKFVPQEVSIDQRYQPGRLLVLPKAHFLYFITGPGIARRYGVGVGRAGLEFTGTATIDVKKKWPTWRPTAEMIEREPDTYAEFVDNDYIQPGGEDNPLYLFQNGRDTYFRIHGTTAPRSIGRSVSNGCIRMINEHVVDLYERVPVGTVVTVL